MSLVDGVGKRRAARGAGGSEYRGGRAARYAELDKSRRRLRVGLAIGGWGLTAVAAGQGHGLGLVGRVDWFPYGIVSFGRQAHACHKMPSVVGFGCRLCGRCVGCGCPGISIRPVGWMGGGISCVNY